MLKYFLKPSNYSTFYLPIILSFYDICLDHTQLVFQIHSEKIVVASSQTLGYWYKLFLGNGHCSKFRQRSVIIWLRTVKKFFQCGLLVSKMLSTFCSFHTPKTSPFFNFENLALSNRNLVSRVFAINEDADKSCTAKYSTKRVVFCDENYLIFARVQFFFPG